MAKKNCSFFHKRPLHLLGLFFILQFVCIMPINGQLPNEELKDRSDYLFAMGVEKYLSKQFEEAIPFFRECAGIDSIIYDSKSSRLGYASMWLASCHFKLGNEETASSISDYYMINPIDRRLTVKSDSISDIIYPLLFENRDVESAISLIQEVLFLERKELGEHNVWIGNTYDVYGYAKLLSGHADEAINSYKKSLSIVGSQCGENSKPYAFVLCDLINAYNSIGDVDSAYTNAFQLLNICKFHNVREFSIYYLALSTCCDYLLHNGKYEEAISCLSESQEILSDNQMENTLEYAITLYGLGRVKLLTGNIEDSRELLEKSYLLFQGIATEYSKGYLVECMDYLSQAIFSAGDTVQAINLNKEAISFFEDGQLEKNYLYPKLHFNLWNIYVALKEPQKASPFAEKAIESYRSLDCKDVNYASLLYSYSEYVPNFRYAIDLASEALSYIINIPNIQDSVLVMYRCQLANNYLANGDVDSAYYHVQIALKDIKSKFSSNSLNYIHVLSKIAPVLWLYGKREDALDLIREALSCVEKTYPDSESHFGILLNLANFCHLSGLYTEAVDMQKKAVRLSELLYGKKSDVYSEVAMTLLQYSFAISDLEEQKGMISQSGLDLSKFSEFKLQNVRQQVLLAVKNGNISEAESLIKEASQAIGKDSIGMTFENALFLMFQAEFYNFIGKPVEALSSLNTAYTIATGLFGKEKFDKYYFNYWNLLGTTYINMKRWKEAEVALTNSISAAKLLFGENNMEYLLPLAYLATIKSQTGDAEGAAQMMSTLFNALRDVIFTIFATMSSNERTAFWSQVVAVLNPGMPFFAYDSHNPKYYGDGYNALLLSKGLLLNTEQEIAQLLINSKDEKGLELYNRLLMLQQKLNSMQIGASSKATAEIDGLREAIRNGERELIAMSSSYGDYTRNLRFSWQDVKESLKNKDVAIEFADFYDNNGNNLYVAFVLTRDMEAPQIIRLFDYADFSCLDSNGYYKTDSLYNLVWKPLESFFSIGSRIFFSPQGVLHNVAIESLPSSDGIPMSNRFAVFRLSSTRELCVKDSPYLKKSAVLYGDIDYDVDGEQLYKHTSENEKHSQIDNIEEIGQVRGAIMGELPRLPGTKFEVDSIASSFVHSDIPATIFTKGLATESSFRSLSSNEYTILHVATHGYYISSSESEQSFLSMLTAHSYGVNKEDLALLRSGLFFAGANTTLFVNQIVNSEDDGILTAKEVANIDLHSVEMVSLSACQTGLGDISGDGVFGIQRGFKKAGVKSLLMSLWKVDDKATCALMTEFYKCWLGGLSKYDALESAKSKIKSIKGWEDPIFWAAFILLDGIN